MKAPRVALLILALACLPPLGALASAAPAEPGAGRPVPAGALVPPGRGVPIVPAALSPGGRGGTARVIVMLVPGLTVEDLRAWNGLLRGGRGSWAYALVSLPGGGSSLERTYATLAAGTPLSGGEMVAWGYERDEPVRWRGGQPAGAAHALLTGEDGPAADVVHLGMAALRREAGEEGGGSGLGALGDALRSRGLETAAFGNADLPGSPWRAGALLAADGAGRVDRGIVGGRALRADSRLPSGTSTDWDRVAGAVAALPATAALVVVEAGDLARLDADRSLLEPQRYQQVRAAVLADLGQAAARLLDLAGERGDLLWLLAPGTAAPEHPGQDLGVAALWLPGHAAQGGEALLLTSPGTRRAGVIASVDVLPTLAAWFGVPLPTGVVGRPALAVPGLEPLEGLAQLRSQVADNHARRVPLLKGYVLAEIGLVGAAAAAVAFPRLRSALRPLLLASTIVPATYLLLPLLPARGAWAAGAATLAAAAGLAWLLARVRPAHLAYALAAALCAGLVFVDLAAGGRLVIRSPLGYSLIGGARFYGIGNEYEGVVLGGGIVALGGAAQALRDSGWPPWTAVAILGLPGAALIWALGSPGLGADFGGVLAGTAAVATALSAATGTPLRPRQALALLAAAVLAAGGVVAAVDVAGGAGATHVAMAVDRIGREGWPALADVVARKLAMNLRLIRYTIWSRALLALLLVATLLVFLPRGRARENARRFPVLHAALRGALAGGLAALALNDSGVVAAATALIYAAAVFIDLVLVEGRMPESVVRP